MLNKTRNHWLKIISDLIKDIFIFIVVVVLSFEYMMKSTTIACLVLIIFLLYISINLLAWKNNFFYIENNTLIIQSGVIQKSKKEISLQKITTLDMKTNFIFEILGLYILSINTGAIDILNEAEFKFLLKEDTVNNIKYIVSNLQENKKSDVLIEDKYKERTKFYKMSARDIFIYTFTKSKIYSILFIGFIFNRVQDFISDNMIDKYINKYSESIINIGSGVYKYPIHIKVLIILISILLIYILATLLCFLIHYNKYNNFKLYRVKNRIFLEYGLISRKKISFEVTQINYMKYNQGLVCQMLGMYSVEVEVIGYNEDENIGSSSVIYPLVNKKVLDHIIKDILPEFEFKGYIDKPKKEVRNMFFVKRYLITSIIALGLLYFINLGILFNIAIFTGLIIIQTILGYMNYKNTSIGFDNDKILLSYGGIKKITNIILEDKIESIGYKQNIFQRNKNVYNYQIDVCSENIKDLIVVNNIEEKYLNILEYKIVK